MSPEKNSRWDLVEGIVEIRFDSGLLYDAILGLVYKQLVGSYSEPKPLPILQLPESVRQLDENLKYNSYYQFLNEDFSLELGPRVVIVRNQPYKNKKAYIGWDKFYAEVQTILAILKEQTIFSKIERIGVRYINFFKDMDIFEKTQINANFTFETESKILGVELNEDISFTSKLQITNNASININNEVEKGSIIDIDTSKTLNIEIEDLNKAIDDAHTITKGLLLEKVLKKDYIDSTNSNDHE